MHLGKTWLVELADHIPGIPQCTFSNRTYIYIYILEEALKHQK